MVVKPAPLCHPSESWDPGSTNSGSRISVRDDRSGKKGFTLVELLVVIVIMGILASLTLTLLQPAVFYGRGRDARRQSDLELVRGALAQYYLDNARVYPDVAYADLQTPLSSYLESFPSDPGSGAYAYAVSSDQKCYELSVALEVQTPSPYEVCGGSLTCQAGNGFCQSE